MNKFLFVIGTRPEAIKMIPLIKVLDNSSAVNVTVCSSGQHSDLLDHLWEDYGIYVHYKLGLMDSSNGLNALLSNLVLNVDKVIREVNPDLVLVHGDTTTALGAALAAFNQQIKIAHIEAGLRSNNLHSPFPEEANRRLIDTICNYHFAPTEANRKNLLDENIPGEQVFVVGNTGIDMIHLIIEKAKNSKAVELLALNGKDIYKVESNSFNVLFTMHRRENFGSNLENIIRAIQIISKLYPNVKIYIPVHPNPNVYSIIKSYFINSSNVYLLKPIAYEKFILLMSKVKVIFTDSGGIQEEAPSFGIPVFIMRENTERAEGVELGVSNLVGANTKNIVSAFESFSENQSYSCKNQSIKNPFGDGKASLRIKNILLKLNN